MQIVVERFGIIAALSLMEEDGARDEQPITEPAELRVGGRLPYFMVCANRSSKVGSASLVGVGSFPSRSQNIVE
jgi:hypothetical protein